MERTKVGIGVGDGELIMVEVLDTIYVDNKTMKWLKNNGRDILIGTSIDMACEIINENSYSFFNLEILLGGEGKCSDNNSRCDNDCPKRILIPKGKIQYIIGWHGFEEALKILEFLEFICETEEIQKIFNRNMILRRGLLKLIDERRNSSRKDTFLTANCGHGVDIGKWLEKDEIPVGGLKEISSRNVRKSKKKKAKEIHTLLNMDKEKFIRKIFKIGKGE